MIQGKAIALLCFVFGLLCSGVAQADQYSYTEILPDGWSNITLYGINNNGDLTGNGRYGGGVFGSFLYSNGAFTTYSTSKYGSAFDINDNGDFVTGRGYLYSGGNFIDLNIGIGWDNESFIGINNNGDIVGSAVDGYYGISMPILYSNGSFSFVDGYWPGNAADINNNGEIIGGGWNNGYDGYIISGGTKTAITYPGKVLHDVNSINDNGYVVGAAHNDYGEESLGFSFYNGSISPILPAWGTESTAIDINNAGVIVGSVTDGSTRKGFLFKNGTYIDIGPSGWTSVYATSINENGTIIGFGTDPAGVQKGFIATVVPEPISSILFLTGGIFLAGRRFIKRKKTA